MATILMVLIGLAVLLFVGLLLWGGFLLLVQLGIIAKKAAEKPTHDHGTYTLDQGREVGGGIPPYQQRPADEGEPTDGDG